MGTLVAGVDSMGEAVGEKRWHTLNNLGQETTSTIGAYRYSRGMVNMLVVVNSQEQWARSRTEILPTVRVKSPTWARWTRKEGDDGCFLGNTWGGGRPPPGRPAFWQ